MQAVEKKGYTYEDYAQLPEGAPYQLIDGELVMSPSPTPTHQRILFSLSVALHLFVKEHDLGQVLIAPMDVYLSETDTPQPDILFIAKARLEIIGEKYVDGAPDLVMEILSPSTAYYDLKKKKRLYEASGVKEYWIVDGELVMSPSPTPTHQRILFSLSVALHLFVKEHDLGQVLIAPMDVYLSETDTPQPDILFIAKARLEIIGEKYVDGAPDLVMEILSPSTAYYDLKKKKRLYEASGVKEYWIVDPEAHEIEVYALVEGRFDLFGRETDQGTIISKLLAGFSVDLADVF